MTKESEAKCPCCGGRIEYSPDQDGARDYQCPHCGWSEHVPGSEDIAAALTLEKARSQQREPTIAIFLERGVVQGIEGNAPARIILCDFDVEGVEETATDTVGGRRCLISAWDSPEEPSVEFEEALRAASSENQNSDPQEKSDGKETNGT